MARIIPTNHEAAQALATFQNTKARKDEQTVLLYDERADEYSKSLKKAFSEIEEEGSPGPDDMTFKSPSVGKAGSTGNQFDDLIDNICDSEADTVYFAGRMLHLQIFALKLAEHSCNDGNFTVISGPDAASLRESMSEKDWETLRGKDGKPKVKVQYAAPGIPTPGRKRWRIGRRNGPRTTRTRRPRRRTSPVSHRAQ
ncbi:hypothetical protein NKH18_34860 [Streptomyces sp. M10(2022)]